MIYSLKILGTLLAIAAVFAAAAASLAGPLVLALKCMPYPWGGIVAGVYGVFWFCVFAAVAITFDTWDERP